MAPVDTRPTVGDAFGAALIDALDGDEVHFMDERSDGYVDVESTNPYFAPVASWPEVDRSALDLLHGRVLDVGAGAGRLALALRDRGHSTLSLDTSPGAIDVCAARGLEEAFLGTIGDLARGPFERFDHAALLGNNLGLLGSRTQSIEVLATLRRLLGPGGRIVGTGVDPFMTDDPVHLDYHDANRRAGRLPGQIRLRVRYRTSATEWFDYLFTAPRELDELARSAGWRVEDASDPNPIYLAVLVPDD